MFFIVAGPLATSILPRLKKILMLTLGTEKNAGTRLGGRLRSRAVRMTHGSLVYMTVQGSGADNPES